MNPTTSNEALVIDDDAAIRDLVREVLEIEGYTVHMASSGRSAATVLREHPGIRLVVTDILMPDEDGLEVILRLRRSSDDGAPRPKILAISGGGVFAGSDLYLANAAFLGADLSLRKPFSDKDLVDALHQLQLS